MAEIVKFTLNNKFREPFRPLSMQRGILGQDMMHRKYVGRKQEFSQLTNLISTRSAANILVSGLRGTGKSSYVNEAIRSYQEQNKKTSVVVEISMAWIPSAKEDVPEYTLKSLVRGLYFSLKDQHHKISDELKELYEKTYYTDLESSSALEVIKTSKIENRTVKSETRRSVLKLSIDFNIVKAVFLVATTVISINFASLIMSNIWAKCGFFVLLVVGLLAPNLSREKEFTDSSDNSDIEGHDHKTTKSGVGNLDLSAETLEIILKQELRDLALDGKKIIFVFDELDKVEQDRVYPILESLKNLFTLSSAIFIFITDAEFFDSIEDNKRNSPYSTNHTLFTDLIFLPNMDFEDISELIDDFKEGELLVGDDEVYDNFKLLVGWKTKNHVFDVHSYMSLFCTYDSMGECSVSVVEDDETTKGNIDSNWRTLSALQLFVTNVFHDQYYSNNPRMNQKLFLTLREVAAVLCELRTIQIEAGNFLSQVDVEELEIGSLSLSEIADFNGIIEDMLDRMSRLGFVTEKSESEPNVSYTISGEAQYPSKTELTKVRDILPFEKEFLDKYAQYQEISNNIKPKLQTLEAYSDESTKWGLMESDMNAKKSRRARKSEVQGATLRIAAIMSEMPPRILLDVLNKAREGNQKVVETSLATGIDGRHLGMTDPKMADFYDKLESLGEDRYKLLHSTVANSRLVVIGFNLGHDIQSEFLKISQSERDGCLPTVFNITTDISIVNESPRRYWQRHNLDINDYSNLGKVITTLRSSINKYI